MGPRALIFKFQTLANLELVVIFIISRYWSRDWMWACSQHDLSKLETGKTPNICKLTMNTFHRVRSLECYSTVTVNAYSYIQLCRPLIDRTVSKSSTNTHPSRTLGKHLNSEQTHPHKHVTWHLKTNKNKNTAFRSAGPGPGHRVGPMESAELQLSSAPVAKILCAL